MNTNFDAMRIQLSVATNTIHTVCRMLEYEHERPTRKEYDQIADMIDQIESWYGKLPKNGPGIAYKKFLQRTVKDLKERLDD